MTSDLSSERALRMPHLRFAVIWVLSVALFWKPWAALTRLSLDNFRYSHLLLSPLSPQFSSTGRGKAFSPA